MFSGGSDKVEEEEKEEQSLSNGGKEEKRLFFLPPFFGSFSPSSLSITVVDCWTQQKEEVGGVSP